MPVGHTANGNQRGNANKSHPGHPPPGNRPPSARPATLLALYAEDAELHVVDRNDQPSHPKIIRGRQAIGEYLADVCGRDMTHTIERLVVSESNAAFVQACRYPSGPP